MSRYKNNSGYKDMSGMQNKTQKPYSSTKGQSNMMGTNNIKKASFSTPSNNYHKTYEKPKPERTSSETIYTRKDQNLMKIASSSATNYNNGKQQPTKYENKVTNPKQDQIRLGASCKGDLNQSKILNSFSSSKLQQDQKQSGLFQKADQSQSKCFNSFSNSKTQQDQKQTGLLQKVDQTQSKILNSSFNSKPQQDVFQKGDQNQSKVFSSFSNNKTQQDQKQTGLFQKADQNQSKILNSFSSSKSQQDKNQSGLFQKADQNQSKIWSSSFNSRPQQDQKGLQNQSKISNPFSSNTSQPDQNKSGKSYKEDQNKLGMSYKEDQNQSKASNSFFSSKPQQDLNNLRSKQDGGLVSKKAEPNLLKISTSASQPQSVWKNATSESKTLNHLQDNKDNEHRKRENFFASYAANIALVKTMKHMWQSPKKGKDANPMKCSSYVASEFNNVKYKPDELVNSSLAAHSFWEEQTTNKAKNNVSENFFTGQSKLDLKVSDKAEEPIKTETSKLNQSFENANLKTENRDSKENKEEELQIYLLKEPALTALYNGLPADQIKQAIKEKLERTGTAFTSIIELIEAVSNLKKQNQEIREKALEENVTLTEARQEDGIFVDREMLEEIKMLKQEKMCKICLDAEVGIVFVPCGHLLSCIKCSENIKTCPLCRVEIQSSVKTFLS